MTKKFKAVCLVCYTCELTKAVGIREAERACVGHMNMYGHQTTLLEVRRPEVAPIVK
jgi:hypothetical protein